MRIDGYEQDGHILLGDHGQNPVAQRLGEIDWSLVKFPHAY